MKTIVPGLLCLVGLAVPASAAHAASTPPAQQVLARMKSAVAARNSMHLDMQIQLTTQQSIHLLVHVLADASSRPRRIVERVTTQAAAAGVPASSGTTQRAQIVVSGSRAAMKQGSGAWRCDTVAHLLGTYFNISSSVSPQISGASNLGPATVDGIPSWHLRGTTRLTLLGLSNAMPTDLYIARSNDTLVREVASLTLHQQAVTLQEQLVTRVSRYGEAVKAQLPAACKG